MKNPQVVEENKTLLQKISYLGYERNKVMVTMMERIKVVNTCTPEHKQVLVNFVHQSVTLLPKITYLESEAAYKIERFYLGDRIAEEFENKYKRIEYEYKKFLNEELNSAKNGNNSLPYDVIVNIAKAAEEDFKLNSHLLLQGTNQTLIQS